MYFIVNGKVNVLSPNETQIIASLTRGNYFGEIALFMPNSRRICSVVAETFSELFILDKKSVDGISKRFPTLATHFMREGERRLSEYNTKQRTLITAKVQKFEPSSKLVIPEEEEEQLEEDDFEEEKNLEKEIRHLLNEEELTPFSPLSKKLSNRWRRKSENINLKEIFSGRSFLNGFDILKLRLKVFNGGDFEGQLSELDSKFGLNEYVENDEFNFDIKRQSRRVKCKKNSQRRFSRITLGQELILSKFSGLAMQWGINNI